MLIEFTVGAEMDTEPPVPVIIHTLLNPTSQGIVREYFADLSRVIGCRQLICSIMTVVRQSIPYRTDERQTTDVSGEGIRRITVGKGRIASQVRLCSVGSSIPNNVTHAVNCQLSNSSQRIGPRGDRLRRTGSGSRRVCCADSDAGLTSLVANSRSGPLSDVSETSVGSI